MTTEQPFNWHDLPHRGNFLSWLVINVISKPDFDQALANEVSEASDNLRSCVITMQINGIEVDAMKFINGVEHHMDYSIEKKAREMLMDKTNDAFEDLETALNDARRAILNKFPRNEDDC